jgi:hypothetical protein
MTTPTARAAGAGTAVTMLTSLAAVLGEHGLRTRLVTPAGAAPVLLVTSREAADLRERITAAPLESTWHYWWSWQEPVPGCGDTTRAADAIRRVLRTTTQPSPARPGQP